MTDTVVVEVPGVPTVDDLGTETHTWNAAYTGAGLVQVATMQPKELDSAGRPIVVQTYICKLPYHVQLDDWTAARIRVTASLDPANLGTFAVLVDGTQGWATCRRLICTRSR